MNPQCISVMKCVASHCSHPYETGKVDLMVKTKMEEEIQREMQKEAEDSFEMRHLN